MCQQNHSRGPACSSRLTADEIRNVSQALTCSTLEPDSTLLLSAASSPTLLEVAQRTLPSAMSCQCATLQLQRSELRWALVKGAIALPTD
mmetsp:Transcript_37941/g.87693  ORF Transcript_37941/g.87693 Transcript_37941/m.87693 type:complete len:90 (+) Transcript_37941:862-1131(+)